jgi:hypothetical protein
MTRYRIASAPLLTALTAVAVLTPAPTSRADELRQGLGKMAGEIKKLLDGRKEDSIAVGPFSGPATLPTSAGPGIQQLLSEELQRLGITVKARAKLGIKGEYKVIETPSDEPSDVPRSRRPKVLAIELKGTVEDNFGKPITDFSFKENVVKSESAFVDLIGVPVTLPPRATPEQRNKKLRESYDQPKTFVKGTRVSANADDQLAIEVLIDDQPQPVKVEDGLAYLAENIGRGKVYAVRLINDSDREMAVELKIDGLSMFQFSELRHKDGPNQGQPLYGSVIVEPHKHVVVRGWHCNNEQSKEFKVTAYPETAAASVNQTANVGTITANFRASWPTNEGPPADEPSGQKGPDGTGFGDTFNQKVQEVPRKVGVIRASVSVRYSR